MASPSQPTTAATAGLSPTAQTFLECVNQLLGPHSSQEGRRYADEWLRSFQTSVQAWEAVDQVLGAAKDPSVLFLAAQTLNRKLRYDKEQLGSNPASWESLRSAVASYIFKHAHLPPVRTQLALAIVALLVQMEGWKNGPSDLIRLFERNPVVLLEVLQRLPEDIADESLDVTQTRRSLVRIEMNNIANDVLVAASQIARNQQELRPSAFSCMRAWVAETDVQSASVLQSGLLGTSFEALASKAQNRNSPAAADLLVEIAMQYEDKAKSLNGQLIEQMLIGISGLLGPFQEAVRSGSHESAREIARVFSHVGELYAKFLLEARALLPSILELSMTVLSYPDFKVARMSYYFYMSLLRAIENGPTAEMRSLVDELRSWFDQLLAKCVERFVRPEGLEDEDEDDESESGFDLQEGREADEDEGYARGGEFQYFRDCLGDVIKELYRLEHGHPRSAVPSGVFADRLTQLVLAVERVGTVSAVEGVLSAVQTVVLKLCRQESPQVDQLVETCLRIGIPMSKNDPRVRRTLCDFIVEVDDYCLLHPQKYLQVVLTFLLESLRADGDKVSSKHAAYAFRHLCWSDCHPESMFYDLERLLEMSNPYDENLNETARLDVLEGLTGLWARATEHSLRVKSIEMRQGLSRLFLKMSEPPLASLSMCVAQCAQGENAQNSRLVSVASSALSSLTILVRDSIPQKRSNVEDMRVEDTPECVPVILNQIWPHLNTIGRLPDKTMENVVALLKYSVRTLPDFCLPYVPAIVGFAAERYARSPACAFLYLTGVLFQQYFDYDECHSFFAQALVSHVNVTLSRVLVSPDAFVTNPDFVDDLFYLASRSAEYVPHALQYAGGDTVERLVGMAATVGLTLSHREAFRSVAIFICNVLDITSDVFPRARASDYLRERAAQWLMTNDSTIADTVAWGLAAGLPADRVYESGTTRGNLTDVILRLYDLWGSAHLESVLSASLVKQAHLSNEVRVTFIGRLLDALERTDGSEQGEESLRSACMDFHAIALRRLRRAGPE